jgi:hypothetical protein
MRRTWACSAVRGPCLQEYRCGPRPGVSTCPCNTAPEFACLNPARRERGFSPSVSRRGLSLSRHGQSMSFRGYRGRDNSSSQGGRGSKAGDVGSVPRAMGHLIENTGNEALRAPCLSSFGKFLNVALPDRLGTLTDCDGVYSESCSPDPPNSFGKSFSFGRPSCMGKGQGRTSAMAAWLRRHLSARSSDGGSSGGHRSCCSSVAGSMASSEIR